jgi:hypothetical protein
MEKRVVLQYSFGDDDGTRLMLVRLHEEGHNEWKVQSGRKNVDPELPRTHGHYASVSEAVQLFSRELLKLSHSLKEDAHEGWFLPAIDTLLEDAFRRSNPYSKKGLSAQGEE